MLFNSFTFLLFFPIATLLYYLIPHKLRWGYFVFTAGLFKHNGGFYFGSIMGILGVFLLYRLVFFYQDFFSDKTMVGRQLCFIGRNTLPIYLIHYFFFLGLKLPKVGAFIDVNTQWGILTILVSVLTLIIVYASLGVVKLLSISKILSQILIGKK